MASSSQASAYSVAESADPGETLKLLTCECCRRRKVIRLVSSTGHNPGRVFFKCPNHKQKGSKETHVSCNFFFWIEYYVEKLLGMGVPVHPLELEAIACLAAKGKTDELGPLTLAAIAGSHRSALEATETNSGMKRRCRTLMTYEDKNKGKAISEDSRNYMAADDAEQIKIRLDVVICVCVLILALNLYAVMK